MAREKHKDSFWLSYSDLMTSLFFIMLVLFVVCICKMKVANAQLQVALKEANATNEQLQQILQLDKQFKELSTSSHLGYDEEKKMFYAKDFVGVEIFNPFTGSNMNQATVIKNEYLKTVDEVGRDLQGILKKLSEENKEFRYQLVIEGTAAIPWKEKMSQTYNSDSPTMYDLSYRRALALYNKWLKFDLRQYNTEIIIAGSGFNGINRDMKVEENNKRFIIQIIPKIARPQK